MRCTFFGALLAVTDALKCQQCTETVDHNGNPVGIVDPKCDTLEDDYSHECVDGQNFCGTELIADWMPNGEQIFKFSRGCRTNAVAPEGSCAEGQLTGMQYKDCVTTCDTDNCNDDLEVQKLFAKKDENGEPVELTCYSCSSARDEDPGSIEGKPECFTTPTSEGSERVCPIFANHACFKSKLLIGDEEQHFKGCSAFDLDDNATDEDVTCNEFMAGSEVAIACRNLCSDDKCNTLSVQGNGHMCYSCEVTFNSMGQLVGWGDMSCLDHPEERHLQFCSEESSACITEFEADWRLNGQQTFTMRRGCAPAEVDPELSTCLSSSGNNGNYHTKRCYEACDFDKQVACNDDTEIFKNFNSGGVKSCKTCSSHIFDPAEESDCAKGEVSLECPDFANAACFSSRVTTTDPGQYSSDSYHGCSAFRITSDSKSCFNVESSEPSFGNPNGEPSRKSVCKETCSKDDCNDELTGTPDETPDVISHHYCNQCKVTLNHLNQTVGDGRPDCWNTPGIFQAECPEGYNFCYDEMEVDWLATGDQLVTLRRGCSYLPEKEKCVSSEIANVWQYKDCIQSCSNNLLNACNNDLSVAWLFEKDATHEPVQACFNCETHPDSDTCGDMGETVSRALAPCPVYANKGCFTSISRHLEDGVQIDDTIRGCSTFDKENSCAVTHSTNWGDDENFIDYTEYTNCKGACSETACNNAPAEITIGQLCYHCSVTIDHQFSNHGEFNLVGAGDIQCLAPGDGPHGDLDHGHIWECGSDSVCATHMEVSWLPMGNQITTVERRCAKKEGTSNLCTSSGSNAWKNIDCWQHCDGELCNDNLDIAEMIGAGNEKVAECHTCAHEEMHNGIPDFEILPDQTNCKEQPTEITKVKCPSWARHACFVGDGVQKDDDNNEFVNVYRGCSSFDLDTDEEICSAFTADTNVDEDAIRRRTSICKRTCKEGDDCNTFRFPDWVDPGEGECPTCTPPTQPPTTDPNVTTEPGTDSTTESTTVSTTESTTESTGPSTESTTKSTTTAGATMILMSTFLLVTSMFLMN